MRLLTLVVKQGRFMCMSEIRTLASRALPGSFEIKPKNPCPYKDEMATLIAFKEVIEVCKKCEFYTNDTFVCGH